VRVATFEGDLAERAEEWQVFVDRTGRAAQVIHTLPEARPGASLDEAGARALALRALKERTSLDAAAGQAREVSARPSKLAARTDWVFTFADATIAPLPQGEARVDVSIAGDEVTAVRRYVFVPEEWERQQRAARIRGTIVRIAAGMLFGGLLVASAILGVIAWSRRRYAPWVFVLGMGIMFVAALINAANGWPAVLAALSTAQPLPLQVGAVAGVGLVGLALVAVLVGLALGAVPHRLPAGARLPDRDALTLGLAAGAVAAAVSAGAGWLRTPAWGRFPEIAPLNTAWPFVEVATDPVTGYLTRLAVLLALFTGLDAFTRGWTRRRPMAVAALAAVGFVAAGPPPGAGLAGWLAAGVLTAIALVTVLVTLLRVDLSMTPIVLGTAASLGALSRGLQQPFPAALPGGVIAALLIAGIAWIWFRALRRAPVAKPVEPVAG
jgi:hypothetical protein